MPASSRPRLSAGLWLHLGGAVCTLAYLWLAWSARQPGGPSLGTFAACLGSAAIVSFGLHWRLRESRAPFPLGAMVVWAVAFRLCGLLGGPIYEDDYFRYMWDGFRFATTGSPYGLAPEDAFADPSVPEEFRQVLDGINNPDLPTIYGPVTQAVFLIAYWLKPASIAVLQFLLIGVDLAILAMLLRLARPRNALLYAWCPLVVKEVAFTAHPDGVGVALLLAGVLLARNRRWFAAAVALGLASAAKVFALALAPFVLARAKPAHWAAAAATLAGCYAPFALAGGTDLESLWVFAREWEFNSAIFGPLAGLVGSAAARALLGTVLCAAALRYYLGYARGGAKGPPRGDLLFGGLLLVSPVINAWYLLWLLPFAAIFPSAWAWTASVAVLLSYATGLNLPDASLQPYGQPAWVRAVEYGAILVAAGFGAWRRCLRTRSDSPCTGT